MIINGHTFRSRGVFPLIFALCASLPMSANNITFLGSINQDNQVTVFTLNVSDTTTVDILSLGYAGGQTTDVGTVLPGGFDTYLTLFDSQGKFVAENDDGANAASDPSTGQAFDAQLLQQALDPGTYALMLTQYGNFAVSQDAVDGFIQASNTSYTTDPGYALGDGCPSGLFKDDSDTDGRCRTGNYAIQFNIGDKASASYALLEDPQIAPAVPEPGSFALFSLVLVPLIVLRFRKRLLTAR